MPSKSKSAPETLVFESAITKLEAITTRLECEGTSLADALASFEEGISLTREAQRALSGAEQKVQLLLEQRGELIPSETSDLEDLE